MNSASSRIFWFLMGGAAFLLVAFLLRAPQEGTPSATSTDQSAPGSQPPPPTEPAEPQQDDDRREKAGSESDPTGTTASPSEGARKSGNAVSTKESADSETERDGDAGELTTQEEPLGTLSIEAIDAGIQGQLPEIRECYSAWVKRNPDLGGRILVKFVIATSEENPDLGYARDVKIAETTMDNVWIEGCIASAMEDAEFPSPSGGVVIVTYPFSFSSEPAEPATEREAPPPL